MVAVHHELQQLADAQVGRACAVFGSFSGSNTVATRQSIRGVSEVTPPGLSRAWAAVGLGFLVLVRGFPRVSI